MTYHKQYDIRPINLTRSKYEHNKDFQLFPGHKAVVQHIKVDGENVVTGSFKGEVKVMNFNMYRKDIQMNPSCISIKS